VSLSPEEIEFIKRTRAGHLASKAEFMDMAQGVCELTEVPFAKVCGVTRGNVDVCHTRNLICRIALDRGFPVGAIARFIKRDRKTVLHALEKTKAPG
jgi:hypothetical protein